MRAKSGAPASHPAIVDMSHNVSGAPASAAAPAGPSYPNKRKTLG